MIPISLASVANIRDLGDTRTADGLNIRPGCLIRSAHLGNASEADVTYLKNHHRLSCVVDLRTTGEHDEAEDRTYGIPCIHVPILPDLQAGISHEKQAEESTLFPPMQKLYHYLVTDPVCIQGFRRAMGVILSHDYASGAVLWHCSEGKDRCGLVTALVLLALGVDREQIYADYLTTNIVNLPKAEAIYQRLSGRYPESYAHSVYQAYIADRTYLDAAYDIISSAFLTDTLGFSPDLLASFREQLLTE